MVVRGEAEERDPQERPARQVEGAAGDLGGVLRRRGLTLGGRQRGQVLDRDVEGRLRGHPLHRLAVLLDEGRAQRLVPRHDRPHRGRQRLGVERPGEPPGAGDVVGGVAGREAVEEPEPLLREGERDRDIGRPARDAVLGGRAAAQGRLDGAREAGERPAPRRAPPAAPRRRRRRAPATAPGSPGASGRRDGRSGRRRRRAARPRPAPRCRPAAPPAACAARRSPPPCPLRAPARAARADRPCRSG